MTITTQRTLQTQIIAELGVAPDFDVAKETQRRIDFLGDYLGLSGATGYVLGISGGVDSTVAGRLAQLACESRGATFTAMRLPYGAQHDEDDAVAALEFVAPTQVLVTNIKQSVDAMHQATTPAGGETDRALGDFVKGNIKARQRMVAQYAAAGRLGALVVGTDHAAEAVMGFFTKFGDGACDVAPLGGLTKSRVREIGRHLGVPAALVEKVPTADLEEDRPQLPDEAAYGVTYREIDAYLTGAPVGPQAQQTIERAYLATAHKRTLPVTP